MKKIAALLVCLTMVLAFASCTSGSSSSAAADDSSTASVSSVDDASAE